MQSAKPYSKAERTRQFILERVAPIFNTKGYAATSLADMTEATGLTKGAIYGNFKNKDEVALEAFRHNVRLLGKTLEKHLGRAASPGEQLRMLPALYANLYPYIVATGGCPILNTITDTDDSHPMLREASAQALQQIKGMLEKIIQAGIANGEIASAVDADKLAALLLTLVEGGILIAKTLGDSGYFSIAMNQMDEVIHRILV